MRSKQLITTALLSLVILIKVGGQTDINKAQAVFIYNFLSHIKWPENAVTDKYTIGVYGKTATYEHLKSYIASRKVDSKSIEVINYNTIDAAKNCHVLFVASNKTGEMDNINTLFSDKSCLIIGERSGAVNKGAIVDFRYINGKLGYKLSQEHASKHKLFVSKALQSMSL